MTNTLPSDRFHLQVSELLKEHCKSKQSVLKINALVQRIIVRLKRLKCSPKERQVRDFNWLKKWNIKFPLQGHPACTSESRITFRPPTKVSIVGSASYTFMPALNSTVDIAVQMPQNCFSARDYLNEIYFRKKALYLCYMAHQLSRNVPLGVTSIKFSRFLDNPLSIGLILECKNLDLDILILAHPPPDVFPLKRFLPNVSNLRSVWWGEKCEVTYPTPHYNHSILVDLLISETNQFIEQNINTPVLKTVCVLLHTWLHRRGLLKGRGGFSNFLASYLVAHLKVDGLIHDALSAKDSFRTVLMYFVDSKWNHETDSFGKFFDVVFMAKGSKINLAASLSVFTYERIRFEAGQSLNVLDSTSSSTFETLFLCPAPFSLTFDHFFYMRTVGRVANLIRASEGSVGRMMDTGNDISLLAQSIFFKLFTTALGSRITNIDLDRNSFSPYWELEESCPILDTQMLFGLSLNADHAFNVLERGPSADDLNGCTVFRQLWGTVSSLRKFADGSMCEAVVWSASNEAEKRLIPQQIVKHILDLHIGLPDNQMHYFAGQVDQMLCTDNNNVDTGEEKFSALNQAFLKLSKSLRLIEDIPLQISGIQSISPALRGNQVNIPTEFNGYVSGSICLKGKLAMPLPGKQIPPFIPAFKVQLTLESSGKWPDNLQAVRRLKTAFLTELGFQMHKLFKFWTGGYVFRLELVVPKELRLFKTPTGNGNLKETRQSKDEFIRSDVLPKTSSYLQSLSQQNSCYSLTTRLVLRWLSAHMLTDHISSVAVELIVAHVFVHFAPLQRPRSGFIGFARFLNFMATFDWVLSPCIINFNEELSDEKLDEIQSEFESVRPTLPLMCLCTPCDTKGAAFTQHMPSAIILDRIGKLAGTCSKSMQEAIYTPDEIIFKAIFKPALSAYDGFLKLEPQTEMQCDSDSLKYKTLFPIVEFDPKRIFIQALKECFGNLALFFYDEFKNDQIAFIWKPISKCGLTMKVSNMPSRKRNHDSTLVVDRDAFVEDVLVLGDGIVKSVKFCQ